MVGSSVGCWRKFHDVIDEQIEKAKAVIVLWSSFSVTDWVRGEAQAAHELTKLVPIKIEECKLPINYRGIHAPEVYRSKAELRKFAQMLTDKYRTAQPLPRGATAEPSTATKIEFSDKSSDDFLTKLAAQTRSGLSTLLKTILLIAAVLPAMISAFILGPALTAVASAIVLGLGFCIYTSYTRAPSELWVDAAKRNIDYFMGFIFLLLFINTVAAAIDGISSFTFVAFAILTGLAFIPASKTEFWYKGFGK